MSFIYGQCFHVIIVASKVLTRENSRTTNFLIFLISILLIIIIKGFFLPTICEIMLKTYSIFAVTCKFDKNFHVDICMLV